MHRTFSLSRHVISPRPRCSGDARPVRVPLLGLVTRTLMAVTLKSSSSSFVRSIGERKSESSEWSEGANPEADALFKGNPPLLHYCLQGLCMPTPTDGGRPDDCRANFLERRCFGLRNGYEAPAPHLRRRFQGYLSRSLPLSLSFFTHLPPIGGAMESSKMVTEREGFVRSNEFARFEKGRSTVSGTTDGRTPAARAVRRRRELQWRKSRAGSCGCTDRTVGPRATEIRCKLWSM